MEPIRVAFFIDELKPGAGTENQLLRQLRGLDQVRFRTWLITLRRPVPEKIAQSLPCECYCLNLGSLKSLSTLLSFSRLVRRFRRDRIDIAMLYFVDSNLFVAPAAKMAGVKAVVVNRRDMGYWYTDRLLKFIRWAHRCVDYILVNAHAIKERVAQAERFPDEQIKVIFNGLVADDDDDGARLSRESLGFAGDCPIVGIVANLRPVKQIDQFIASAAIVAKGRPDARFVIIGSGDLLEELQAQVHAVGLVEKVLFTGSIHNVAPYLKLFDVGLLTSESEGLSNTLMEYSYHGLPIVTYDTGGNCEVVADGETGYLVTQGNVAMLASRTLELLNDRALREKQGEAGRRRVEAIFSAQGTIDELEEFLEAIARAGRQRLAFHPPTNSAGDAG